eukprot:1161654-Pelagomonas_calceolata.AAC.4
MSQKEGLGVGQPPHIQWILLTLCCFYECRSTFACYSYAPFHTCACPGCRPLPMLPQALLRPCSDSPPQLRHFQTALPEHRSGCPSPFWGHPRASLKPCIGCECCRKSMTHKPPVPRYCLLPPCTPHPQHAATCSATLQDALRTLYVLDALDADGVVTKAGHEMSAMPLEPALARCLLAAQEGRCERAELGAVWTVALVY